MNKNEVLALLAENSNAEGIIKWDAKYPSGELKSYGIGLTVQRKLAKQIGKNHELALELWKSDVYDARIISVLIDDPKLITREQVEAQVEDLEYGFMGHVFSSCGAPLAKVPFVAELADNWIKHSHQRRCCCGYGLLYELSKSKKKSAPDETYFLEHIERINQLFKDENIEVRGSMGGALMGIGKRTKTLNSAALKVAHSIGPIEFETDSGNCDPLDVVKHLTSDYVKSKFDIK